MYAITTSHSPIIRRQWITDERAISEHFLRLDTESRRARFCGGVNDVALQSYVHQIMHSDCLVYGAIIVGCLRAVAELHMTHPAWPVSAEIALSVEPEWQNAGIGDVLFQRLIFVAQQRNIQELQLICLNKNYRARRLAAKYHARTAMHSDVTKLTLNPQMPIQLTL